jgi:hypothetical protein
VHSGSVESNWLFARQDGSHWTVTQACATLQDITAREIGFPVNPHLIRSLVGDIVEALHPGAIGLTRDILGHKTVATTEAHYRRRRSRDSRERYHGDLEHRLRGSI